MTENLEIQALETVSDCEWCSKGLATVNPSNFVSWNGVKKKVDSHANQPNNYAMENMHLSRTLNVASH